MVKKEVHPRHFSDEFKLSVVEEAISGTFSKSSICKKYSLTPAVLYSWIHIFAPEHKLKDIAMGKKSLSENEEILALKRALQQKELELKREKMRADFYETMVDVAEEMFNIDIRKKAGTKQ